MISVESIMTPDPVTLKATDKLATAHKLMTERHIHHIPVVDADDAVVGLISHRDILAASSSILNPQPRDTSNVPLGEIMTTNVVTITPDTGTLKAAQYIHNSRHGCLPVVDEGSLIGIITEYDFVEVAISLLERRADKPFEEPQEEDDAFEDDASPEDLGIDLSAAQNWD